MISDLAIIPASSCDASFLLGILRLNVNISLETYENSTIQNLEQFYLPGLPKQHYIHTCQYIIATSLFYQLNGHCFKFATSYKNMSPSMPTWDINEFSQGSIHERLVKTNSKLTKLFNHLLKVTTPKEYKKYMVSTNV